MEFPRCSNSETRWVIVEAIYETAAGTTTDPKGQLFPGKKVHGRMQFLRSKRPGPVVAFHLAECPVRVTNKEVDVDERKMYRRNALENSNNEDGWGLQRVAFNIEGKRNISQAVNFCLFRPVISTKFSFCAGTRCDRVNDNKEEMVRDDIWIYQLCIRWCLDDGGNCFTVFYQIKQHCIAMDFNSKNIIISDEGEARIA